MNCNSCGKNTYNDFIVFGKSTVWVDENGIRCMECVEGSNMKKDNAIYDWIKDAVPSKEDMETYIIKTLNTEITNLKAQLKSEQLIVDECESMIAHAIELEYLGEGSTKNYGLETLNRAREQQSKRSKI